MNRITLNILYYSVTVADGHFFIRLLVADMA